MLEWIVSASVLILVVMLLRVLLRDRISMRLRYALWGLVLVRLLLPFSVGSSRMSVMTPIMQQGHDRQSAAALQQPVRPAVTPSISELPGEGQQTEAWQSGGSTQPHGGIAHQGSASVQGGVRQSPTRVLCAVWLCGMGVLALWFLICNLRLSRRLLRSRRELEAGSHRLKVYMTDAVESPCLYGLFRPAVYVTEEAAADNALLRNCLDHERTHYAHGDHVWAVLRCLCLVLHWYNPLVWCAAILSRNDGELACDEAAVKRMDDEGRAAYGRTLLQLSCSGPVNPLDISTSMSGSGPLIRKRIRQLVKKPKTAVYTLAAVLLVAAVAVGCTFTGAKLPVNDPAATPSVTPTPMPTRAPVESGGELPEESLVLYECDGLYVPIPGSYVEDLILHYGEDTEENVLLAAYGKAAVEAYREDWQGDYRDEGVGFLFRIERMDRVALERLLCEDHSGCIVFAEDGSWYYCLIVPTDVRYYPTGDDADLERWEELNGTLPDTVRREFIARNGGVNDFDQNALFSGYTYDGDHILMQYDPYYASESGSGERYTLVLSQPVRQGEGGIWCVERMIGPYGEVYLWFPDKGMPAEEYYGTLQDSCDAGRDTQLLEPVGAARAFLEESGYFSGPVSDESLSIPVQEEFGPADAIYALFDETGSMELDLHLAGEGSQRPCSTDQRWYAERIAVLMGIFEWRNVGMPSTEPSAFWVTAASVGGEKKLTFWQGEVGTVQYFDGEKTVYWQASRREGEQTLSVAEEVRVEYYRLEAKHSNISFYLEGTAEEAAETFVHSAYGAHLMDLAPGNGSGISAYDVVNWEVADISEDGARILGRFQYAFIPLDYDSPDIWAGNTNYGSGEFEGMLTASREFILERREDGYWYCSELGTGGYSLEN